MVSKPCKFTRLESLSRLADGCLYHQNYPGEYLENKYEPIFYLAQTIIYCKIIQNSRERQ